MKMALLLTVLTLTSQLTFAGNETGNGGYGYVCRNDNHEVISARLLDLWEPETFRTFQDNSLSVETQISNALEKVRLFFPEGVSILEDQIKDISTAITFTKRTMPFTEDAVPRYAPDRGCNYEQIARYGMNIEKHAVILEINENIYKHASFSNTDKAALAVHEGLYLLARKNLNLKTSDEVRQLVGKLFSNQELSMNERSLLMKMLVGEHVVTQLSNASSAQVAVTKGVFESMEDMQKIFQELTGTGNIDFANERASVIADYLQLRKVFVRKLWVIWTREYIRKYVFQWYHHVVPVIYLKEHQGLKPLVLDPKWLKRPFEVQKWLDYHMPKNATCTTITKLSEMYSTNEENCFLVETGPEVRTFGDLMTKLY